MAGDTVAYALNVTANHHHAEGSAAKQSPGLGETASLAKPVLSIVEGTLVRNDKGDVG